MVHLVSIARSHGYLRSTLLCFFRLYAHWGLGTTGMTIAEEITVFFVEIELFL